MNKTATSRSTTFYRRRLTLVLSIFLFLAAMNPLLAQASPECQGRLFNPISDVNWNNMFPVTIAGMTISSGSNSNPSIMHMPAVCTCPGSFGIPTPGLGVTYWEPTYVAEVAREPGCLSTLGGVRALPSSFRRMASEQRDGTEAQAGDEVTRMQVHWYIYPVFAVLNMMSTLTCAATSGFNLADLTPIDPTWQDDAWGAVYNPEGIMFANVMGTLSCVPDAVASSFGKPMDNLFWCSGSQGMVYPLTGNSQSYTSPQGGNMHILAKYVAKKHRMAGLLVTIGPGARCNSLYSPFWLKSQYRLDPIAPNPLNRTVVFGMSEFRWGLAPPANNAVRTDSAYLVWVGRQCCLQFF
ncbi:TraU family protein [Thioalkalivibrio thiocyanodenitrificans]|uniref:TraU family protein n=1 Tax=Thioalkalivibrio thiocyanodenitrificans TaxID=243063 RepID=UPI00035CFE16|nr:TraU family protein [Thioalkalivibrio thiocyanodenitrificans]